MGLNRGPSPISPASKFSYTPRQASPASPSAESAKVAPLLPPNKKHLADQYSYGKEKDRDHDKQQPSDYEQEDGVFAQQRQRLKSAQVRIANDK